MCTRASARHEFSFHGWRDNPSLCHFSSVFLSHRLIELPSPRRDPRHVRPLFPLFLFFLLFFILPRGREETESSSSPRRASSFPGVRYPLAAPKLEIFFSIYLLLRHLLSYPAYFSSRDRRKCQAFRVRLDAYACFVHYISANCVCPGSMTVTCRMSRTEDEQETLIRLRHPQMSVDKSRKNLSFNSYV